MSRLIFQLVAALVCLAQLRASDSGSDVATPRYILSADKTWQLGPPGSSRFDASALVVAPDGGLVTLTDRGSDLYKIVFDSNSGTELKPLNIFTLAQVSRIPGAGTARFDTEGVTVDPQGNFYICEESRRWVLRFNSLTHTAERLEIDFAPVERYFSVDRNASFEGIAIGDGRLYLANERQAPRVITVDLKTLKVIDDFRVTVSWVALGGPHYSDLSWYEHDLYILDRNHHAIIRVNPGTHKVLSEYSYAKMELASNVAYQTRLPTGTMEGLAVTMDYFWLVTDNNGLPRRKFPSDIRPTLFRVPRPDKAR